MGRMGRTLIRMADAWDVHVEFAWNRTPLTSDPLEQTLYGEVSTLVEAISQREGGRGRVIWLSLSDDALLPVAAELAEVVDPDALVLHTSGSIEASSLRGEGIVAPTAGVHPLVAITDPETAAKRLSDAFWTVEGDPSAADFAEAMLDDIGADVAQLQAGSRSLYHAAAVLASNLEVALFDAAVEVAQKSGLERGRAVDMLLRLASSALDNIDGDLGADSLSGPVARGDDGTLERHRDALRGAGLSDILDIYDRLTRRASDLVDGEPDDD